MMLAIKKLIKTSILVTLVGLIVFKSCLWYFGKADLSYFALLIILTLAVFVSNLVAIYLHQGKALAIALGAVLLAVVLIQSGEYQELWFLIFLCVVAILMRGFEYALENRLLFVQVLAFSSAQTLLNMMMFRWMIN